jgi:RNA polymerase sigma-70 factor (ECF subfamily)
MSNAAAAPASRDIQDATGVRSDEAAIVAELKAGSEEAFTWLIARYHQPVYSLIYRVLNDPSDAADTTQEVFIKVFRGIGGFHADSSLKTWVYRIALHEASNQRRWWFRHRGRETSLEPGTDTPDGQVSPCLRDALSDDAKSPLDCACDGELRSRLEAELAYVPEPYRSTLILRDIEELSYEEIAEVMEVSLGTVKSRLMRGREALRKRLAKYLPSFGIVVSPTHGRRHRGTASLDQKEAEAMP